MDPPPLTDPYTRTLEHYATIDKVVWVPAFDIPLEGGAAGTIAQYAPTPCIYVSTDRAEPTPKREILQFAMEIERDAYLYTAWRRVIGHALGGVYVDVLLIDKGSLYTLGGARVDFDTLGRSDLWVDRDMLARCGVKGGL